jgi:hypothetical protein
VNLAYFDENLGVWMPLGSGTIYDLQVYNDRLYIVGGFQTAGGKAASGITSWTHPELVSNELPDTPNQFQLHQNYPNPFNPNTVISFQLPVGSRVTLKVFDLLGREVATLVNGQRSAGRHEVSFDASRLSSGMYMYRLETGNQIITKKMMLIK